jgi:ATP-dependent Zn protease
LANSDEENVVCHFEQYGDHKASAIKFWYNECSDENPSGFQPITNQADYGEFSEKTEHSTVKKTISEPTGGAYICCYDFNNDVTPNQQDGISDLECSAESLNKFLFSGVNKYCKATYIEPSSGFPWWIILVLFLIILIVVAAIMWWRKKKNDEEADLEAGNVDKPQQIPDGQIDATQEFDNGNEDENLLKDADSQEQQS